MVLPIVLLISTMMLVTSAAWFETSLAAAHGTTNVREYLQAFHAADSALTLCARSVIAAASTQSAAPLPVASGAPAQWKLAAAFEAGAVTPVAQWPGSPRAPQCLIEAWRLATRADAKAYLLTSRGFGRTSESQVWLQMELVVDGEKIERHWRRVAARPF
ncbi:pilus assembly PilX family protein [Paraburkholderia phytofirmans]|uniref:pilus assembly PilX family protein n=1 Tax=Paraburkholderia phytofirmans TaxID=261302 RepID=UPI0038B9376B